MIMRMRALVCRADRRTGSRVIVLALFCAACSPSPDKIALRPQGSDPPRVAAALSVGGRLSQDTLGSYESAVNCATALRITADRLAPIATRGSAQGVDLARRAADYYRDRAVAVEGRATPSSVQSAIAQRVREKRDEAGSQARLSIACLRALQKKA
jgi:hypothetical protein